MSKIESPEFFREIKVRNQLAESILWHTDDQALWWTDIHAKKIYRSAFPFDAYESWPTPERLCSFGFTQNPNKIIAAFETGFAFYFPRTQAIEWITRPLLGSQGIRFNDGRVDRDGNFWAGTIIETHTATDSTGAPALGSIYRLQKKICEKIISPVRATNSLCWSLNGNTLFYADSPTQEIRTIDLTSADKTPRVFATTDAQVFPDGSIVDADNHLWNAEWLGGRVLRYSPDGKKLIEIKVPAKQSTCLCFAGPELNYLCISTGTENYTSEELAAEPSGGNIFIFKTDLKGVADVYFSE